jgi:hypothetical protein
VARSALSLKAPNSALFPPLSLLHHLSLSIFSRRGEICVQICSGCSFVHRVEARQSSEQNQATTSACTWHVRTRSRSSSSTSVRSATYNIVIPDCRATGGIDLLRALHDSKETSQTPVERRRMSATDQGSHMCLTGSNCSVLVTFNDDPR